MANARQCFLEADADRNGVISFDEFQARLLARHD
jgi:hypothetical protein